MQCRRAHNPRGGKRACDHVSLSQQISNHDAPEGGQSPATTDESRTSTDATHGSSIAAGRPAAGSAGMARLLPVNALFGTQDVTSDRKNWRTSLLRRIEPEIVSNQVSEVFRRRRLGIWHTSVMSCGSIPFVKGHSRIRSVRSRTDDVAAVVQGRVSALLSHHCDHHSKKYIYIYYELYIYIQKPPKSLEPCLYHTQ